MKSRIIKSAMGVLLALQIAATGFCGVSVSAEAADRVEPVEAVNKGASSDYTELFSGSGSASSGEVKSAEFKVEESKQDTYIIIKTNVDTTVQLAFSRQGSSDEPYIEKIRTVQTNSGYAIMSCKQFGEYTYVVSFNFDTAVSFEIGIFQSGAKISKDYSYVTKGFSKTLKVSNASSVKWSTTNKKVATVKKGKVTAKKKGKCYIVATGIDKDGLPFELVCYVIVRNNVYTDTKITKSDVESGNAMGHIHKVSYDKSGNLVVNARLVNKSGHNYSKLQNIKIIIKDTSGKKVATYKVSTKNVSVKNGTVKDLTFTIPKSQVKQKRDLAGGSASFTGTGVYIVYR